MTGRSGSTTTADTEVVREVLRLAAQDEPRDHLHRPDFRVSGGMMGLSPPARGWNFEEFTAALAEHGMKISVQRLELIGPGVVYTECALVLQSLDGEGEYGQLIAAVFHVVHGLVSRLELRADVAAARHEFGVAG